MQNEIALHVVDRGQRDPALVFIHGFTTDLTDWNAQVETLAGEFRCVALDLPGHGDSPAAAAPVPSVEAFAKTINATLDRLQLTSAVLVGHSMGCHMATETCLQRPDRIRGIVYVDGSVQPVADPDASMQNVQQAIDKAGGMQRFVANLYQHFFVPGTPQWVRDFALARQDRIDPNYGRTLFLDYIRWATRPVRNLADLRVPVMVLQSTVLSAQLQRTSLRAGERTFWMDEIARNVPDARLETVLGVGHFSPLEAPEQISELIRDFARRFAG
ncbi:alpha/beta hydrolase [Variovorax paradoxus]|nr:alpha/beta hydrolase [Variovorax paradoxus]